MRPTTQAALGVSSSQLVRLLAKEAAALERWAGVNGGVLAVAALVSQADACVYALMGSRFAAALVGTVLMYALAFSFCAANLSGRPRAAGDSEARRFFYATHRAAHSRLLYRRVHKLHHAHTHDVRLLSSLQMSAADVAITHTAPLLAVRRDRAEIRRNWRQSQCTLRKLPAVALVPLSPGIEMPAPFVAAWLGIALTSEDHQRHHINGELQPQYIRL
ncbi:hypothetical protein EMIHUDRAFT_216548 [Emiliania huxleyi CCMP1516]|uniref:Fatty acid desaturase domain-containing protein n=2 Tax=Emiliania huxleyi TaxID=2903 RepID=A0A0D3ID78_EMIH1|nr:hypothetical protein EMIHUDRAFT_216548 [Emiliania huxleyi CCMP1516]EOD09213.1 hypothetical protein EMIHUDRAFT_216548 [Emiliania huxleyi CCMP1516]|eukprot:XP_005761642.1 hypothetical protein EMIHUDRAFT_216548 [Emiliania huxleyi CCMP1516]